MITETEAYNGFNDKASHAHRGKTKRNSVMFGRPGYFYVYLTYGMHYMLNIVTGEEGFPAAVLIRGVNGISGPGRLTKALHIAKYQNKKPADKKIGLWVEDREVAVSPREIESTARVGIHYAEEWVEKPYRFLLKK